MLRIDFINAFNTVLRSELLKAVALRCQEASPWMASTYSYHSPLHVGNTIIPRQRGLQQGDPCGPAGFCWAVQSICEQLQSLVEWQAWYLDDAILVGSPAQLHQDFDSLTTKAREVGLEINLSKCVP